MTPPHDTPLIPPHDALSLKAAAEHAGVSISTIRRRREALISAGAKVSPSGWAIPIAAINAVFSTTQVVSQDTPLTPPADTPLTPPIGSRELIEQLRSENEYLRQRVEQQARTIERQAEAHAVISAQLTKLGQLEASPTHTKGRHWWQRRP